MRIGSHQRGQRRRLADPHERGAAQDGGSIALRDAAGDRASPPHGCHPHFMLPGAENGAVRRAAVLNGNPGWGTAVWLALAGGARGRHSVQGGAHRRLLAG